MGKPTVPVASDGYEQYMAAYNAAQDCIRAMRWCLSAGKAAVEVPNPDAEHVIPEDTGPTPEEQAWLEARAREQLRASLRESLQRLAKECAALIGAARVLDKLKCPVLELADSLYPITTPPFQVGRQRATSAIQAVAFQSHEVIGLCDANFAIPQLSGMPGTTIPEDLAERLFAHIQTEWWGSVRTRWNDCQIDLGAIEFALSRESGELSRQLRPSVIVTNGVEQPAARTRGTASVATLPAAVEAVPVPDVTDGKDTYLSESDLATHFNVPQSTLRRRLAKWRKHHHNNDWMRVPNPGPRAPRYLYRVKSVRPLIDEIRAADQ